MQLVAYIVQILCKLLNLNHPSLCFCWICKHSNTYFLWFRKYFYFSSVKLFIFTLHPQWTSYLDKITKNVYSSGNVSPIFIIPLKKFIFFAEILNSIVFEVDFMLMSIYKQHINLNLVLVCDDCLHEIYLYLKERECSILIEMGIQCDKWNKWVAHT